MDFFERKRQAEISFLAQFLGGFAAENGAPAIPVDTPAPSMVLTLVQKITAGLLDNTSREVFRSLFTVPVPPPPPVEPQLLTLDGLMRHVFGQMPSGLRDYPRPKNFETNAEVAIKGMFGITTLLGDYLKNPEDPQLAKVRVNGAATEARRVSKILQELGAIGLHNYLLTVSVEILARTELARLSNEEEMKSACAALRTGISDASKAFDEWHKWNNSRISTKSHWGPPHGEIVSVTLLLDGRPYSSPPEVQGWYSVADEEGWEELRREQKIAEDQVWAATREKNFLNQVAQVIEEWKNLSAHFALQGHCG